MAGSIEFWSVNQLENAQAPRWVTELGKCFPDMFGNFVFLIFSDQPAQISNGNLFLIFRCFFDRFRPIQKDARRPYDSFPPIIAPRAPSCVRKRRFPYVKMSVEIRGYHSQMAHRRQIAQWVGTRTTHPGGTGFETGVRDLYLPKTRECVSPCPQGLLRPQK